MPDPKQTGTPEQPQGEVLDLASAAEFLKVSKPTFYRWLAQEKIKGFKAGTQWRFYKKDLEDFLQSGEPQAVQEVEGLVEAVDAARAERGLPPIDWEQGASQDMLPAAWFVQTLFQEALAARASDVHYDLNADEIVLRYRVDGVLNEVLRLPRFLQMGIVSRVKIMADMDLTERRLPQDGRILLRWEQKGYDFRVTTMPSVFGEAFVCRVLDQSSVVIGMDRLGMPAVIREALERKVREPWGLVVFAGPSGCGKTTTTYSAFHLVRAPHLKLVTIEDPVEYQLRDTTQVHVNRKAGLTFPAALRFFSRFDPDVILVSETRDAETAEPMMNAAMTGHLVLTTMPVPDAPSVITRFIEMGVEPFLIASALTTVVAQRLVRNICPECREEHRPSKESLRRLGLSEAEIKAGIFARGKGCPICRQTGYKGRTGVFELLEMDEHLRDLTARRASTTELRDAATEAGMVPLLQEGLRLVREGVTTLEEVMRVLAVSHTS